ncbi:hypothetical protein OF83DRAFT_1180861 [Amylostereum chailletii]|nr:hypothetical protein OF83DRAFT_1180861 [Amylostereum chailletii]
MSLHLFLASRAASHSHLKLRRASQATRAFVVVVTSAVGRVALPYNPSIVVTLFSLQLYRNSALLKMIQLSRQTPLPTLHPQTFSSVSPYATASSMPLSPASDSRSLPPPLSNSEDRPRFSPSLPSVYGS